MMIYNVCTFREIAVQHQSKAGKYVNTLENLTIVYTKYKAYGTIGLYTWMCKYLS